MTSVLDVRRWQQDCEGHSDSRRNSLDKPGTQHKSPRRQSTDRPAHARRRSAHSGLNTPNASFRHEDNINNDFFSMRARGSSPQPMLQNSHLSVPIDRQSQDNWQIQIMPNGSVASSNSHAGISQHQLFGYLNNPTTNAWQLPQNIDMDVNIAMVGMQDTSHATDQQVHSHLFW